MKYLILQVASNFAVLCLLPSSIISDLVMFDSSCGVLAAPSGTLKFP